MLESLLIKNFRCLNDLSIRDVARVNLIVGKNNSGKSTVLEALRIYAGRANPVLLDEIIGLHDEQISSTSLESSESLDVNDQQMIYQNFFSGRTFHVDEDEDAQIYIGDIDHRNYVKVDYTYYIEEVYETTDVDNTVVRRTRRKPVRRNDMSDSEFTQQALIISASTTQRQAWIDLNSSPRYSLPSHRFSSFLEDAKELPVGFIPTQFMSQDYLASLWDGIALTEYEKQIVTALKFIDDNVDGLAFIQRNSYREARRGPRERSSGRVAVVRLEGNKLPIPLSSMGDGMLRMLQLTLALLQAKNGILLIDEFENGLHYSVQEKVWDFVFTMTELLKIQVFATTHSSDCLDAFMKASVKNNNKSILLRLGRSIKESDNFKIIPSCFSSSEFEMLTKADIEVR